MTLGNESFEDDLIYARQCVRGTKFTQMDARHIPYVSELDAIGVFDVGAH